MHIFPADGNLLLQCVPIQIYLPFAELLERGADDAPALDDTVSSHPDIGQVAPDDAVIHDNSLGNPERNTR